MSIHLYCVMPRAAGGVPSDLAGLTGAPVRAIPAGDVVAWVSDVERGLPVSIDGVKEHDAVVEVALETGFTPVPARFGQRFMGDDACRAALATKGSAIEDLVLSVQGLVEMTLLVTPSTRQILRELDPVTPEHFDANAEGAGRQYLEALRQGQAVERRARDAATAMIDRVTEGVAPYVRRMARHEPITRMPLMTISHLVARVDVADYRRAAEAVGSGSDFRLLVIGPRAPYSFSSLGAEPGGGGLHGMNLAG